MEAKRKGDSLRSRGRQTLCRWLARSSIGCRWAGEGTRGQDTAGLPGAGLDGKANGVCGRAESGMKVLRRSWSLKTKGTFQEEGGVRPRGAVLSFCTQVGGSLVWRPSMQVLHRDCPCSNPSSAGCLLCDLGCYSPSFSVLCGVEVLQGR